MTEHQQDSDARDVVCRECGARYPADMENQAFHAIAHGYLYHPPEPGSKVRPPAEKRERVRDARRRFKEAGLYD